MNFQINTNMNTISDFNKAFSNSLKDFNANLDNASEFNKIYNEQMPINTGKIQGGVEMNFNPIATNEIENIQNIENTQKVKDVSKMSETEKMANDFGAGFKNGLNSLNDKQKAADNAVETLASGGDISIHEVMIASQKSSLAMQMAIQLRNKTLDIYNELKEIRF